MNHPSPSDPCRDPFEHSLEALISGDASAKDHTILNDTLRVDSNARRIYIQTMAFEAMLAREFADPEETLAPKPVKRWPAVLAIAATIMLAATLAWRMQPSEIDSPLLVEGEMEPVITHAVVTSLEDASGRFEGLPLSPGQRLPEGMLELDQGYAEITFDTGAEVTLEGPARFQLESENRSRLASGKASAHVPEQARGFVVLTPSSYIRDLGTAFTVEVREDTETDLHVLEGEVEVAATGRDFQNSPKILRQREAVRLAAGKMQAIHFNSNRPRAKGKIKPQGVPSSFHWSFDEWDGKTSVEANQGHELKLRRGRSPDFPEVINGKFGQALRFHGDGGYAASEALGVLASQACTVACWVRIQPDYFSDSSSVGIINWGVNRSSDRWQIAWNRSQNQGALGAPRVEFGNGFAIGSTDLRDGRWHHLAVVYLGGQKASVATHVRIYVDGRLESITGRRQRKTEAVTAPPQAKPLTLGGNVNGRVELFVGDLDEVHLFEGSLLPGQISRLMKSNSARGSASKKVPEGEALKK